jgi:hypothetical protein
MATAQVDRTQIFCHECSRYLTVEIDLSLEGNHLVVCPCGHRHYRKVQGGKVTDVRWGSANKGGVPTPVHDGAQELASEYGPEPPQQVGVQAPSVPNVAGAAPVFNATIVFVAWTQNAGGASFTCASNSTTIFPQQMGQVFLQDAWANTLGSSGWAFASNSAFTL